MLLFPVTFPETIASAFSIRPGHKKIVVQGIALHKVLYDVFNVSADKGNYANAVTDKGIFEATRNSAAHQEFNALFFYFPGLSKWFLTFEQNVSSVCRDTIMCLYNAEIGRNIEDRRYRTMPVSYSYDHGQTLCNPYTRSSRET